jgi:hypothetical protein
MVLITRAAVAGRRFGSSKSGSSNTISERAS